MDKNTTYLLTSVLIDRNFKDNIQIIQKIYKKFETFKIITIELVTAIFNEINTEYYEGKFLNFLESEPKPRKSNINFNDTAKTCAKTDAILEATEYEQSDEEIARYDFGFNIAIQCLNSIKRENIYYSGGFITKNKIIFLICMLLHESLHIIEYKDSFLNIEGASEHSKNFYINAYKKFKIISRLSQIITNPNLLKFNPAKRITDITSLTNIDIRNDGVVLLNDYSNYMVGRRTISLGYLVHDDFKKEEKMIFLEDLFVVNSSKKRRSNKILNANNSGSVRVTKKRKTNSR